MLYKDNNGNPTDDVSLAGDDDTPDVLTKSQIVGAFMSGEEPDLRFDFCNKPLQWLANDYMELVNIIRSYKPDSNLTFEGNLIEKMARINEFLDETLLEYVSK